MIFKRSDRNTHRQLNKPPAHLSCGILLSVFAFCLPHYCLGQQPTLTAITSGVRQLTVTVGPPQVIDSRTLCTAILRGDNRFVEYILQQKPQLINASVIGLDTDGQQGGRTTPLHCAVTANNAAIVKRLIELGASGKLVDGQGSTALAWAVRRNVTSQLIALLLDHGGALFDLRDVAGGTPLQAAVANANLETLHLLLSKKANVDAMDKKNCSTPLFIAVALKATLPAAICTKMNFQSSKDENFINCQRHFENIMLSIASALVQAGANGRLVDKCTGDSPLSLAKKRNDLALQRLIAGDEFNNNDDVENVTKPSNDATTAVAADDSSSQLQQLAQFDLLPKSRCTGSSRGFGAAPHLGNVRMISVDECAIVCEEVPLCYGFNLMLSETSGSKGNGCIIKAGPCFVQRDEQFAFYRKKSMANFSNYTLTALLTRSPGMTALKTRSSSMPVVKESNGKIFSEQNSQLADQMQFLNDTNMNNVTSDSDSAISKMGPTVNDHPIQVMLAMLTGPTAGTSHIVGRNANGPPTKNPPINQPSFSGNIENSNDPFRTPRKEVHSQPNCGPVPWYGWLLVGFGSGICLSACIGAFFWQKRKSAFNPSQMQPIKATGSGYFPKQQNGKQSAYFAKGSDLTKSPVASLSFSATSCWSSKMPQEGDDDMDCQSVFSVSAPHQLPADEAKTSSTSPTKQQIDGSSSSTSPTGVADGDYNNLEYQGRRKKKKSKRFKLISTGGNKAAATTNGQELKPEEQNETSDIKTTTKTNEIKEIPTITATKHTIKALHKVYVDWPPSSTGTEPSVKTSEIQKSATNPDNNNNNNNVAAFIIKAVEPLKAYLNNNNKPQLNKGGTISSNATNNTNNNNSNKKTDESDISSNISSDAYKNLITHDVEKPQQTKLKPPTSQRFKTPVKSTENLFFGPPSKLVNTRGRLFTVPASSSSSSSGVGGSSAVGRSASTGSADRRPRTAVTKEGLRQCWIDQNDTVRTLNP